MTESRNSWIFDAMIMREHYLEWLYSHIGSDDRAYNHYWRLVRFLFKSTFYYTVKNDDNRAADGLKLREQFIDEFGSKYSVIFDDEPCNMLEMMVALARRIDGEIMWDPDLGDRTPFWFWKMIDNLGVDFFDFSDENYDENCFLYLSNRIDKVVSRTYSRDGNGGLFPLKNPQKDQRKVEIWGQMQAWMQENYPI